MPEAQHHISSAIVVTRAECAESVAHRLQTLEGVEIHAAAQGKIVIVIEGPTAGHLGEMLLKISAMDDVIAAHMVFEQAIVEQEMSDDGRTHAA